MVQSALGTLPDWARWLAVEPDGSVFIFAEKPFIDRWSGHRVVPGPGIADHHWRPQEDSYFSCISIGEYPDLFWRDSLRLIDAASGQFIESKQGERT